MLAGAVEVDPRIAAVARRRERAAHQSRALAPCSSLSRDDEFAPCGRSRGSGSKRRKEAGMTEHEVGTREEWLAARTALLAEEKELTRRSDELARKRQTLPWVAVEKDYSFETEDGKKTLADLFDGHSQLLVYHFYSCYDRGTDVLNATWQLLDRTPKGRGDDPDGWPRRHDEYEPPKGAP